MTPPPSTGTPTIVKVSTAADLLRLVPHLTPMRLECCAALVLFRGRRTHGVLRLDLPPGMDDQRLRVWAARAVGTACKVDGVDGVVAVVYTDRTFAPTGRPPLARVLRGLDRQAGSAGLDVRDLLVVAADGWGSLGDHDLPRGGHPLTDLAPREGDPPTRPPMSPPEPPRRSSTSQDAFAEALERWWVHPEGPGGILHGVDLRRRGAAFGPAAVPEPPMQRYRFGEDQADVVELIDRMLDPHDDAGDACCPCRALLYAIATRQGLENLMLAQFGWGCDFGRRLWSAAHDADTASPDIAALGEAISGGMFRRPDPDRLERAIEVVTATAGLVPPSLRAPLDGLLAWLHWALGGGSIAGLLAERALAADPDRDIPRFVLARVGAGILPEWAFREDPAADPYLLRP